MGALRTDEILRLEAAGILTYRSRIPPGAGLPDTEPGTPLYRSLNECGFSALCLSGGGIRSAAFSLGVIQALAHFPHKLSSNPGSDAENRERARTSLLSQFDYLSTVSGGGYIGSWLSAWCNRKGFNSVWRRLVSRPDGPDIEPQQISWLRSYSNYLTPKVGLLSTDTWSGLSTYICNLSLNWLMILPLFCCAVVGLKILAVLLDALMIPKNPLSLKDSTIFGYPLFEREEQCSIHWQPYAICGLIGVLFLIFALSFVVSNLVLRKANAPSKAGPSQKSFVWFALLPSVVSAVLTAQLLASDPFGKLFEELSTVGCSPLSVGKVFGAPVSAVTPSGLASSAGIQKGDVISMLDANVIEATEDFAYFLEKKRFWDVVWLEIKGRTDSAVLTLIPAPEVSGSYPNPRDLGIAIATARSLEPRISHWVLISFGSVLGAAIYVVAFFFGWLSAANGLHGGVVSLAKLVVAWALSGAAYGAMLTAAFYWYLTFPGAGPTNAMFIDSPALPLTIGVPLVLIAQLLSQFIFVGLSSYRPQSHLDREWQAVAGGWLLVTAIGWFAISFLTFGALLLLLQSHYFEVVREFVKVAIVPISGLSGIATAFLSKSALTSEAQSTRRSSIWTTFANVGLAIAAPLFIAGIVFLLSVVLDDILLGHLLFREGSLTSAGAVTPEEIEKTKVTLVRLSLGFGGFFALLCGASYYININSFSLHAFYRNRLIRAFLGASRVRSPNRFYKLDPEDDPKICELWPPTRDGQWQPFHVINLTLNLVAGEKLAWQERKAAPFTVTALHCGVGGARPAERPGGAYRPSDEYGAKISLGTAMAISGAAVSPNMGYHSSPAVTFLMSMLNVRLGWWLGNPAMDRGRPYLKDGPTLSLLPLLAESFGLTTASRRYVYLSDGGHFENLGLYEMVRRRCRFILVVDAGCDRTFSFEDLGNAVRKIAIDLDVAIRFCNIEKLKGRSDDGSVQTGRPYHAMGEIDYRSADGAGENGILLYIKPAYHGTEENPGVRGYAISHRDFPHQSTADQWFTESQFESYRALGFEITNRVLEAATTDPNCASNPTLESVFHALHQRAVREQAGAWAGW